MPSASSSASRSRSSSGRAKPRARHVARRATGWSTGRKRVTVGWQGSERRALPSPLGGTGWSTTPKRGWARLARRPVWRALRRVRRPSRPGTALPTRRTRQARRRARRPKEPGTGSLTSLASCRPRRARRGRMFLARPLEPGTISPARCPALAPHLHLHSSRSQPGSRTRISLIVRLCLQPSHCPLASS